MSVTAYPSSEFVQLAGREVKLQYIEHEGARIEDAAQRIKAVCDDSMEEIAEVRNWICWEFNLPATIRAHCEACFIRVLSNEQFYDALHLAQRELRMGERTYKLHWQSRPVVCRTAPLIAVSFRRTHDGECFAVAQVWAPKTNKPYQPTTTPHSC